MTLLTNRSAQIALQSLRAVQTRGIDVRSQISTGLKVRSAKDNAAFFLVASTTRGDLTVLKGLRDNLTVVEGGTSAAEAGLRQLNELTLQIADLLPASQNGVAIDELEVAFDQILDQAREVINASGFQGTNLLSEEGTQSTVVGLDRTDSAYQFDTLDVTGADFLRDEFPPATTETAGEFTLQATDFTANVAQNGNEWVPSTSPPGYMHWVDEGTPIGLGGAAQAEANAPRLDYTVEITTPGIYYVNVLGFGTDGGSNSVHVGFNGSVATATAGVNLPKNGVPGWGTSSGGTRVSVNIPTTGPYTFSVWGRENGAYIEGVQFTQDPTIPGAGTPLPPVTPIGGSDLPFFTHPLNGAERREQAGLMELLEVLNPEAMLLAPESAMIVLDSARAKITQYQSEVGAYNRRIDSQRGYLDTLTDGLEQGVSALVDADLAEQSSRLQALEVQEQLAIQSLIQANTRSTTLLTLFQA